MFLFSMEGSIYQNVRGSYHFNPVILHLQYSFYVGIYNTNMLTYIQYDVRVVTVTHISVVCNMKYALTREWLHHCGTSI